MSYPFSKLRGFDSKAAGEIAVIITEESVAAANTFVIDLSSLLKEQLVTLSKALAKSRRKEFTTEANEIHGDLKRTYVDLRTVVRAKSNVISLKEEGKASGDLYRSLERHGGAINRLPRHAMITALENIIQEMDDDEENMIAQAKVLPIYEELMRLYHLLITVEKERNLKALQRESIPCEGDAALQLDNTVRTLYHHISDYADINKEGYRDLLAEFDRKLAPIFIHLKGNETRHHHERDESCHDAEFGGE